MTKISSDYSLWAKDLVFVISDGYLDGMHAWLNVYHGAQLSSEQGVNRVKLSAHPYASSDLNAESLELTSGVIWTALNLDYPGHSFSHLGLFFGKRLRLELKSLADKFPQKASMVGFQTKT